MLTIRDGAILNACTQSERDLMDPASRILWCFALDYTTPSGREYRVWFCRQRERDAFVEFVRDGGIEDFHAFTEINLDFRRDVTH